MSVLFVFASGVASAMPGLTIGPGASWDQGQVGNTDLGCGDLVVNGTLDMGAGSFSGVRNVVIGATGTLNGDTGSITLSEDWSNDGTFSAGTGTITWDDTCIDDGTIAVNGDTDFYNINMRQDGRTVVFEAGATTGVMAGGHMDMGGIDPDLLTIKSSAGGSPAFLIVEGTYVIDWVDVMDNHAELPGEWIDFGLPEDFDSVDSGGNLRWFRNGDNVVARFKVTKEFSDGNQNGVMVYYSCNGGQPHEDSAMVSEVLPMVFTIDLIDLNDGPNCHIWEDPDAGYTPTYDNQPCSPFIPNCSVDNSATEDAGCYYEDVFPGDGEPVDCRIHNQLNPVDITWHKVWEPKDNLEDILTKAQITIDCDGTNGGDDYDSRWIVGDDSYTMQVLPHWQGGTHCTIEEGGFQLSSVDSEGCDDVYNLVPGSDDVECTIVNTVFFEGIPTLSDLGLLIMALMMLGVGMVGYRRFI